MKKLMFFLLLLGGSIIVNAQASFGVQVGGLISNMTNESTSNGQKFSLNGKSMFGWRAGLVANVPVGSGISFMPQLNVLQKGCKFDQSGSFDFGTGPVPYTITGNIKLTYLEVPLYFVYNSSDNGEGFFAGLGPTFSYGLSGKETDVTSSNGSSSSSTSNIKFDGMANATDNNIHFKALEIGASVIAGYKLSSGLVFNIHYNLGLNNNDPDTGGKSKSNYFGFGIGYFLLGGGK